MADAETEPAAEESPPAPAPADVAREQWATWQARDRRAELEDLAADPEAVAAARRRLQSMGVQPAPNPFGTPPAPEKSAAAAGDSFDWRQYLPKGRKP